MIIFTNITIIITMPLYNPSSSQLRYGEIKCVYFPKPLQISIRPKGPNMGYGFVRFIDKRDLDKALRDIQERNIIIDGSTLEGEYVTPQYWPSDKTRRYY